MPDEAVILVTVGVFGLVIGSFLNVVIVRLPAHRSLWRPGSACPGCGTAITWRDNIPVVSFVLLRGRCRACAMKISWRYPLTELATAVLWMIAYAVFGFSSRFPVAIVFLSALVVITVIDLTHQIIPDVITLPGILAGFLANLATGWVSLAESLIGIAVGGGLFLAIFVAVLLGGTLAVGLLVTRRMRRKDPIPFGPFLALGGAVGLLWGDRIVQWYVSGFIQ